MNKVNKEMIVPHTTTKEELLELISICNADQLKEIKEMIDQQYTFANVNVGKIDIAREYAEIQHNNALINVLRALLPDRYIPSFGTALTPYYNMPISEVLYTRLLDRRDSTYRGVACQSGPHNAIGEERIKILKSTVPMIINHTNNLIKQYPNIKTYNELSGIDYENKEYILKSRLNDFYDYVDATYGERFRQNEIGFTFSQKLDTLIKGSQRIESTRETTCQPIKLMAELTTLEKLKNHDYSDVKKLIYKK